MVAEAKMKKGWTRVAFGDVVERVTESGIPTGDESRIYIGLEHLDSTSFRVTKWGSDVDLVVPKTRVRQGDVLFARRNTRLRRCAVAPFDTYFSPDGYAFRSNSPQLLHDLILYIVASDNFMRFAIEHSAGTHSKRVKWSDLAKYEFALPPLEKQRRILGVLKAALALEERLLRLFASLRSTRESWLEQEFSVLAREWPEKIAGDLMQRITVGIVVKPAALYVSPGEGVPALRSLNVLPYKIVMEELVYISPEGHADHRKSRLTPGDVVVVRSGRPGDAAVVPSGLGDLNGIDLIICGPSSTVDPAFLCAALNSRFGRRQFLAGIAGTAQKHFNVGALKKFRIPVPPMELQERFVAQLQELAHLVANAEQRLTDIHGFRLALMRKALEA